MALPAEHLVPCEDAALRSAGEERGAGIRGSLAGLLGGRCDCNDDCQHDEGRKQLFSHFLFLG